MNTLINKGAVFARCIEQNPDAVQAVPVIEQLLDETLGKGWICHSFLANGADPGGYPQGLHIDQGPLLPWITEQAPAGTIMLFDGRVLHGTGVNRSDRPRFVATMSNVKSWMRTQENWVISVAPYVLEAASPKLLHRLGLQALTYGATIEGFGLGASGRVGDPWGSISQFRSSYDRGEYRRVRELSADSPAQELNQHYTVFEATRQAKRLKPRS